MSNSLSRHGTFLTNTPQTQPIPGRTDMVKNSAGGYGWEKDTWTQLRDFIILGTEGGTFYADERSHTYRNVGVVAKALAEDGPRAVKMAVDISTAKPARAPKNYPALYVIAAALASKDLATRRAAAGSTHLVARTTDHQAHLFGYLKDLRGGGGASPLLKRAYMNMFTQDEPGRVVYRYLKARSRKTGSGEPFSPADLLRLAKPTPTNEVQDAMFALISGRKTPMEVSGFFDAAKGYYEAQLADTPAKAVRAILAYRVPWEFLPDSVLKYPEVWEALIPTLGITALIRNLSRMTINGALGPFKQGNLKAAARLCDQAELHNGRVHPFDLFLALRVYESGWAQPNPKAPARTWTPVPEIVDALNRAFVASFAVADKVPGNYVVAVDSSGSMTYGPRVQHGGSDIGTPYGVSLAFANILMRTTGGSVYPVNFDTAVRPSPLRTEMSLSEIMAKSDNNGGATDCAAPIEWALEHRHCVDGFIILTDNESWSGGRHAHQALEQYRRQVNPNARVIWCATTANGHQLGDPGEGGVLQVAGFDSSLPMLVNSYMGSADGR